MNNKGVTLVSLIITIIVMLIIAGVTIGAGNLWLRNVEKNKIRSELLIIQQVVRKQYLKYETTKDADLLVGTPVSNGKYGEATLNKSEESVEGKYYELSVENLNAMKLDNAEDVYIVNYKTGETLNKTQALKKNADESYVYNVNDVHLEGI